MDLNDVDLKRRLAKGDELRDAGDLQGAMRSYDEAASLHPESYEARYKLGTAYQRLCRRDDATKWYREAIQLWNEYPEANNNLGLILFSRGELDEAERHYRVALVERPDFLEAHLNLCGLLVETSRLLEATFYAKRALQLSPNSSAARARLGQIKRVSGKLTEAIQEFGRAVELDPSNGAALSDLGSCYWQLGRHIEAEAALHAALAVIPDHFPAWNNLLLQSNYRLRDKDEVFKLHKAYGEVVRKACGPSARPPVPAPADPRRRLRIAFLSGDLRRHSVAYFLRGALAYLDRRQFQIFAYSNFRTEDEVTWQLKPLFHRWRSIHGIDDDKVASMIREDRIDILIDLAGHTASARPMVLGHRPAPVQVHWIGYPNTTGLDCVDFRIVDPWTDPPSAAESFSTESIWRLPRTFLCYSPPDTSPDPEGPPSQSRRFVTFGSFNSRAKLGDECIKLWSDVLLAVPNSRLVLKSMVGFQEEAAHLELVDRFRSHGIEPDRIDIFSRRAGLADHLSLYAEIDIALDTFPYNGTTTTCEALWMGVPVVCLAGDRHASRVGVSILNNVGLSEFVASAPEDYARIAISLSGNLPRLQELRFSLRDRMRASPLMDQRAMGTDLGDALREMWRISIAQLPAAPAGGATADELQGQLTRLHIGGTERREGWTILDIEPRPEVDIVCDLCDLDSLPDESCSEIYCSYVLDFLGYREILAALNGIHRVLVPGGRFYLSVPDLDVLVWLFSRPDVNKAWRFKIMALIYGDQSNDVDFRKIGLNYDFLEDYLHDVGFSAIEHVEGFGLFDDSSELRIDGFPVSLNLVATK